jgi:protein O-GlcNAc transferase
VSDARARARQLAAALEASPQDAAARFALAQTLKSLGDVNGAVRTLAAGVQLAPADVERWLALAALLMEIELASPKVRNDAATTPLQRAIETIERALALAPAAPAVLAQAAMTFRYACAWDRVAVCEAALDRVARDEARPFAVSPMIAAAVIAEPALQARAIRDFVAQTMPHAVAMPRFVRQPGSALRVGYLSADFHEHATAHLMAGMFDAHDRARVETFAYALDADDGSAMRRRLENAFDHWRDVRDASDEQAAALVARDSLDVLVDLKGHTSGSRIGILARRPAPRQIHYLGFPGTIAHPAIDAQVADAIVVPPGDEAHYREHVLRLPVCYQVNDRARPLPATPARTALGLPERGLVMVCFNQTYKLGREFVDAWLDALSRHADAVLWLNVPHALARRHLRAAAQARGVDAERIVFAPIVSQVEHLARLRCADLALDVLPYGSHTTASDALWCGVPLLTLTGATFAGRVGTSLVSAVNLPELAMPSMDAYRDMLETLASDRERLVHYKVHLERERYDLPLFDTQRFTREFETLLESATKLSPKPLRHA